MKTVRLTTAQAIVRYLVAQRTVIDGSEAPLFPGVFAIFGHGNVTGLGFALDEARDELPTIRGQNEQGMALAAVGYAKAMRRRQIMVATSSIGPGATNMVTAAGVAMANRLPVLLLSRRHVPEPHPRSGAAAGRALRRRRRPRSTTPFAPSRATGTGSPTRRRSPSRCRSPSRRCSTRPTAARPSSVCRRTSRPRRTTTPSGCSSRACTSSRRQRPDARELDAAAAALLRAQRPLRRRRRRRPLLAGRGRAPRASSRSTTCPSSRRSRASRRLTADHPCLRRADRRHRLRPGQPARRRGRSRPRRRHAPAGLHDRLVDRLRRTTTLVLVGLNAARFDAAKHRALPVVGDAREGLDELGAALGGWRADAAWAARAREEAAALPDVRRREHGRARRRRRRPTRR